MKQNIGQLVGSALQELQKKGTWPVFDMPVIDISRPKNESFGDYTCNVAMVLAKTLGKSPMSIAEELKTQLMEIVNEKFTQQDSIQQDSILIIQTIDIAAPGYLNFTLKQEYFSKLAERIIVEGSHFGSSGIGEQKKVLIEFISANPTGPIHLGNARGGPSGDILANVLEKSGYSVDREYYVNDFGNQVRVLGHSILGDEEAQYRGGYVDDLRALWNKESAQKNSTSVTEIGFWATQNILETIIKPTCEKAGVHFQNWFSEKSLHDSGAVDSVLAELQEKDLAYEQVGALWFRSTKFGDDKDRVLTKSDATKSKTYTATDLAYHKNKVARGYDVMINVQGADHLSQAAVVKRFVEEVLGAKDKLQLIITQFVRIIKDGVEVKMSKRKGIYFAWDDLIEEVGRDAVRFIFASYAPTSHIDFDINVAREKSNQNPVYYVQYAHARIASIIRKAEEVGLHVNSRISDDEKGERSLRDTQERVQENVQEDARVHTILHVKEMTLLRELSLFPELLADIAQSYDVHKLPHYAIRLADVFHSFYSECKVIDEADAKTTTQRLQLVAATQIVLAETLRLIGVSAPEKM